ncbi:metallophosphoesterase family protein [Halorhabdus sp. SVX81]|uniref:metallophosphoesterase family protein n=1 Tax=Halorhabdus sp. SVX81 TaxID=2978283 RepID=UPI0023DA7BF4|nr:metallophosphoesterase family protein [Halorhabdus sp. SVX81]
MSLTFDTAIEARHRRIDPDDYRETYVIGDVHGCRATLDALLDQLDAGPDTLLVFVGDLVRKGPDSEAVIEFVRTHDNAVTVMGNNERKLVDGEKTIQGLSDADLAYLEGLPLSISWPGNLVVHGGIDPRKPLGEQTREDLLTFRSLGDGGYERPYWFEQHCEAPRVFFGHTVLAEPFATAGAVGLDTGCVYGGHLTAYRLSTGEFVSVEPAVTHQSRSTDSIVEPRPQCRPTA